MLERINNLKNWKLDYYFIYLDILNILFLDTKC